MNQKPQSELTKEMEEKCKSLSDEIDLLNKDKTLIGEF